jgi:hypothetical protein
MRTTRKKQIMTKSLGDAVAADTVASRRGVKPQILVDVYGKTPPKAAVFGQGISDRAGAQQAQDARRNAVPGQYERR